MNAGAGINLDEIQNTVGNGASQLETQLNETMEQISANPSPSAAQLTEFQANLQLWSNMIQLESSIYKVFNDSIKQVVTNSAS